MRENLRKSTTKDFREKMLVVVLRPFARAFIWFKGLPGKKKKMILGGVGAVLILGSFGVFGLRYYQYNKMNPNGVWEVLVVLRSQTLSSDPVEDAKGALKRGDAIAVREPGHKWSDTEYKSYLLVKIEGRKKEVEKLLEPEYADATRGEEAADNSADGMPKEPEIVRARKYKVDMSKVGFDGEQVVNGQPVEDKIFNVDIIKEK